MRIHSILIVSFSLAGLLACEGEFTESHEVEPNDDILHATEIAAGDDVEIVGSCRDAMDRDYFKVTAAPGVFKSSLHWKDGAFEIGFKPESGVESTATVTSAESPIELESAISAGQTSVVFVVDCAPAGTSLPQDLDYRVVATVPK